MARPKGKAEPKPRLTRERIKAVLDAIGTTPRSIEELSEASGLTSSQTGEVIADLIRTHRKLILWDGKRYFSTNSAAVLMDFAAEHPQHFMTVLCVWRLGYRIKVKL